MLCINKEKKQKMFQRCNLYHQLTFAGTREINYADNANAALLIGDIQR